MENRKIEIYHIRIRNYFLIWMQNISSNYLSDFIILKNLENPLG